MSVQLPAFLVTVRTVEERAQLGADGFQVINVVAHAVNLYQHILVVGHAALAA